MEDRLQHQPTAFEPQRAHTNRVRSTPQGGAKLEQTLLMNEGKLGSRSADASESGAAFRWITQPCAARASLLALGLGHPIWFCGAFTVPTITTAQSYRQLS